MKKMCVFLTNFRRSTREHESTVVPGIALRHLDSSRGRAAKPNCRELGETMVVLRRTTNPVHVTQRTRRNHGGFDCTTNSVRGESMVVFTGPPLPTITTYGAVFAPEGALIAAELGVVVGEDEESGSERELLLTMTRRL